MDRRRSLLWALALLLAPIASAQIAISPRAGLIHYVEGRVSIDGEAVAAEWRRFPHLEKGQVLQTGRGRAEVLLAPNAILRADHETQVRILSDDLTDVVVELVDGSAVIECRDIADDNRITVLHQDSQARILTRGSYRIDISPEGDSRVRVYRGRLKMAHDGTERLLKSRRVLNTSAEPVKPRKFDPSQRDAFDEWSRERVAAVAELREITPYSDSQILDGLSFLGRHSQSPSRRPGAHHGRPYLGSSHRRHGK